jgi:Reverse transcriptase (RNA-dependent DNA polymerase)
MVRQAVCRQHRNMQLCQPGARSRLNADDLSYLQPSSNLSFISKIIERAVASRFTTCCNQHNLLPSRQSAYRQDYSTETAVTIIHNDIVRSLDQRRLTALLLLDLSAAFDTVDHRCRLNVLKQRFAVDGSALEWFRSYLSDRTQTFTVRDDRSATNSVNCSVPQGSVLGPVEFITYTEDVVTCTINIKLHIICLPTTSSCICTQLSAGQRLLKEDCWLASMIYACGAQHDGCS